MTDTHAVDRGFDRAPGPSTMEEVVVGFDGTPEAEMALRWAAGRARALRASLTVVHAIEPPAPARRGTDGRLLQDILKRRSAKVAAQGAQVARSLEPALTVRSVGVVGGPAAELIAHSSDAGLLVVGRRRRGQVLAAALGSVSFAVSMHARCPVVVCPAGSTVEPWSALRPVVVGVDGSPGSKAALDLAGTMATATHSAVTVVGAWQGPSSGSWDEAIPPYTASGAAELSAAAAREEVEEAVACLRARHRELEVEGTIIEGNAVDVLVAASAGVAAVVVGSRGQGGFAGMMLGSVSHGVLRAAMSPVAVVRRGAFA